MARYETIIRRMEKRDVPKTWIEDIKQMFTVIEKQAETIEEYGAIIENLAAEVECWREWTDGANS